MNRRSFFRKMFGAAVAAAVPCHAELAQPVVAVQDKFVVNDECITIEMADIYKPFKIEDIGGAHNYLAEKGDRG